MTCWNLIEFTATDDPPWRAREQSQVKPVSEMIDDITQFQQDWDRNQDSLDQTRISKVKQSMLVSYMHNVNIQEDIGTQVEQETRTIIHDLVTNMSRKLSESETETSNLYRAWMHLREISDQEKQADPSTLGLLDIETCVQKTHRILMRDIPIEQQGQTPAGVFSTKVRHVTHGGEKYTYPQVSTIADWETILDIFIVRYNGLITAIKDKAKSRDRTELLFKCAAWFLFELLDCHPFSDGNGRLCRLLANYMLMVVTPFATPIYNIHSPTSRDDYLDALKTAREHKQRHPSDLMALIVESNWYAWKKYRSELDTHSEL